MSPIIDLVGHVVKVLFSHTRHEGKIIMYIDFSPSAKTLKKIEKIAKLREQNVKWEVIAKRVGNKVRYCQALQEYYLKVMEGKIK